MPNQLEMEMREIWCENGGNKGISTHVVDKMNTKIVLNAFTIIRYVCTEKFH